MPFELELKPDRSHAQPSSQTTQEAESALQPVSIPIPKTKAGKPGVHVDTAHAPTVDQVLNPQHPSMDGASQEVVLKSIENLVRDIYDGVLNSSLDNLKVSLAKTAPPPTTPFALTLLGWVVETIASWTIASIGKIAAKELFGAAPARETFNPAEPTPVDMAMGRAAQLKVESPGPIAPRAGEDAVMSISGSISRSASGAIKDGVTTPRPTTEAEGAHPTRAEPGETLLAEFITNQKLKLLQKKNDAIKLLLLMRASAVGKGRSDFVNLDEALSRLIGSPDLTGWFHQKVTMEWMNFVARVSLGPRGKDQHTDMVGANTIDGIAEGGPKAQQKWTSAAGFVEITLTTPDQINGLHGIAVQRARIPSSYGSALKLHDAHQLLDEKGSPFNLATLPVYRRIWLQTGDSKLTTSPAFVITPEGTIETDANNPVLAAIGSGARVDMGESTYLVGSGRFGDTERSDPNAWLRRAMNATHCTIGAHRIHEMLRGVSTEVIK